MKYKIKNKFIFLFLLVFKVVRMVQLYIMYTLIALNCITFGYNFKFNYIKIEFTKDDKAILDNTLSYLHYRCMIKEMNSMVLCYII